MTGIQTYSTTASENINANTGITWDEGMAPALVNDSARQNMADIRTAFDDLIWFQYGSGSKSPAPVYASGTSFTQVAGSTLSAVYHVGRRIKATGTLTGTIYGVITATSYGAGSQTVTVAWDTGSLSNEAITVYLSQVPLTGLPVPSMVLPTRQVLTSGSGATYTTPSGCRQIKVRMVGAGGGGAGSSSGSKIAGGVGGDTIFNSIHAAGGAGAASSSSAGGYSTSAGSGSASFRIIGQGGGSGTVGTNTTGGIGGASGFGSGASAQGQNASGGQNSVNNTGGGGSGAPDSGGGGGQGGEYVELLIPSPSATYTYTIGAGGTGGAGSSFNGGNGGSGLIIVDEFY